jgi:signal peptidase I
MDSSSPLRPQDSGTDATRIPLTISERRGSAWASGSDSGAPVGVNGQDQELETSALPEAVLWPEDPLAPNYHVFHDVDQAAGPVPGGGWAMILGWGRFPARFIAMGVLAYLFAFNFSVVRGSSMAPGIHDGDRILIDQLSYLFTDVDRGDIVVLQYPLDPNLDYIKRVVGLPGDAIVMELGQLWVNGERVHEDYLQELDLVSRLDITVRPGHFFVLGDNRLHSSDSREFGQVREELVRGKVDIRIWPPARAGRIH